MKKTNLIFSIITIVLIVLLAVLIGQLRSAKKREIHLTLKYFEMTDRCLWVIVTNHIKHELPDTEMFINTTGHSGSSTSQAELKYNHKFVFTEAVSSSKLNNIVKNINKDIEDIGVISSAKSHETWLIECFFEVNTHDSESSIIMNVNFNSNS